MNYFNYFVCFLLLIHNLRTALCIEKMKKRLMFSHVKSKHTCQIFGQMLQS